MMNRITITAAALSSAAAMLTDHSEEAPDGAIMADVERLSDMLAGQATAVGGSVPTELRVTVEPEPVPPVPFEERPAEDQERALQEAGRRLVAQEIHLCVSSLVYGLTRDELPTAVVENIGLDSDTATDLWSAPLTVDDYRDALTAAEEKLLQVAVTDDSGDSYSWQILDEDHETLDSGEEPTELEAWRALFDADGRDEPEPREIYEHWAVSDWLGRKLTERGERVVEDILGGLTVWARPTTGQAIYMDSVMREIAAAFYLNRAEG